MLLIKSSIAQVTVPFTCPGSQVIAYKLGTSCTSSQYRYYTINSAGVQAATPFYTLTSTSREVNGFGINSVDQYLYGIEYDRSVSCTFSNFHLFRYDAVGGKEDLGIVPAIAGGIVQTSMGCVSLQGDFIYSVINGSGNRYIALISNIAALPPSSGTLTAAFKQLVNNCTIANYADWAIDPTSGKLYSYGIYNNSGVSTGTVIEINPVTGSITCVGTPNTSEFFDHVRDNFGGVYFSGGGMLYGCNVNTRRLYRIDVNNGSVTFLSTMSGSGQMRADMGSCDNGWLVLPVKFIDFSVVRNEKNVQLNWHLADADEIVSFQIEGKSEKGIFNLIEEVKRNSPDERNYSLEISAGNSAMYYRIAAVSNKGQIVYSKIVKLDAGKNENKIKILENPVNTAIVKLSVPESFISGQYIIYNSNGIQVKKGFIKSSQPNLHISGLKPGMYFLQITGIEETLKFVVQ